MTPTDALALLDRIAANAAGTRLDHERIVQAVQTIRTALEPPETGDKKTKARVTDGR